MSRQQQDLNKEFQLLWERHTQSYQELQQVLQEIRKDEKPKPQLLEKYDEFISQSQRR